MYFNITTFTADGPVWKRPVTQRVLALYVRLFRAMIVGYLEINFPFMYKIETLKAINVIPFFRWQINCNFCQEAIQLDFWLCPCETDMNATTGLKFQEHKCADHKFGAHYQLSRKHELFTGMTIGNVVSYKPLMTRIPFYVRLWCLRLFEA